MLHVQCAIRHISVPCSMNNHKNFPCFEVSSLVFTSEASISKDDLRIRSTLLLITVFFSNNREFTI